MFTKTRIVRMVASVALVSGGILGIAAMGVAGTAGAQPAPSTTATPDILPNSTASTASGATTTIRWKHLDEIPGYTKTGGIAITECNANVLMGDPAACNQTNIDGPGGPYLASSNTLGKGHLSVAMVEGTVGDGTCSDGTVCYISISNESQSDPVSYGLIPIAFNPAA